MKIGILSLPLYVNYGGILQAYALQAVLEQMGHEVTFIQKRNWPLNLKVKDMPIIYAKRIVKNLMGQHIPMSYERIFNREAPIICQNIEPFIRRRINIKVVDDFSQLDETDFDAIVVGSDQIWRPLYVKHIESAFLDFAKDWDIKRIAYAASFGTDRWEYTKLQNKHCRKLVQLFDAVSVRERSGVMLCKEYLGVEAKHVLDPTMLLDVKDYINLFEENNTPKSQGNLLCYILDESEEKSRLIDLIAKQNNLKPFRINAKADYRFDLPVKDRIQPSVEQWLRGFYDAEFVITDSFHACVFSILFKKPFVVYGNKNRGMSRFTSLLDMFGLRDCMITCFDDYKNTYNEKFDSEYVYSILTRYKNKSLSFIESTFM